MICLIELILKLLMGNNPYNVVLVDKAKVPVNLLLKPSLMIPLSLCSNIHPSFKLIMGLNVSHLNNLFGAEKFRIWETLLF